MGGSSSESELEEAMRGEEGRTAKKRRKGGRRKADVSRYLDDMADESSEEEEGMSRGKKKRSEEEEDVEFVAEVARQNERRGREKVFGLEDEAGEVVASLVARYASSRREAVGGRRRSVAKAEGGGRARHAEAPSLTDPRLWMVLVEPGKEAQAVLSLTQRCATSAREGEDAGVSGATWTGLRGTVYIESRSEAAARGAIAGLRVFRVHTMRMVPVAEMTSVASTRKRLMSSSRFKVGDWAKLARGEAVYKGDTCRVVAVGDDGATAVVQLVPRPGSRSGPGRPARRPFSAAEAVSNGGSVEQRRFRFAREAGAASRRWALADDYFEVYEEKYYRGGFLYKEVKSDRALEAARPSMEDLERFAVDDALLAAAAQDASDKTTPLSRGDAVVATEGDLAGLPMTVERVERGVARCRRASENLVVSIEVDKVRKVLGVGERVKVVEGRYAGQTGVVVETHASAEGDALAVVVSDSGGRELSVRAAHCQASTEIARGHDTLAGYQVHDLVQLPVGAVGLVVRVNLEDLELLDARGERRSARPNEVSRKLNAESARNVTLDSRDEHVREKDVVLIDDGRTEATVLRAYRASLWVLPAKARPSSPDGGVRVVRARRARVAGARIGAAGLANTYMGLGRRRDVTEANFKLGDDDRRAGRSNRTANNKDALVGRVVRICRGNYKGLAGLVKNATATHVTVELHTRAKLVTEPRERVKVVQGGWQEQRAVQERIATSHNVASSLGTPFLTQHTPMLGAPTPQYGANTPRATPSHAAAFGTPSHAALGTPSHAALGTPSLHRDQIADVWRPRQTQTFAAADEAQPQDDDLHSVASGLTGGASVHTAKSVVVTDDAWLMPGVEASYDGIPCRIEAVTLPSAKVTLLEDEDDGRAAVAGTTKRVPAARLKRVQPQINDHIRVNDGGAQYDARLLEIEDTDGIIKLDTGEYKIIDFSAIGKIAPKAAGAAAPSSS